MFRMIARTQLFPRALVLGVVLVTWAVLSACAATENTEACKSGEIRNEHGVCVPTTEP